MALNLTYVEYLSQNSIRAWFDTAVVVGDKYYNKNNYSILSEDNTPLEVLQVVYTPDLVRFNINLYIRNQTPSKIYTLTVNNLNNRLGESLFNNTISWKYNKTKIDSFYSSLPKIYDKRPISYLGQIGSAIAYSDNIIGGSPNDMTDVP